MQRYVPKLSLDSLSCALVFGVRPASRISLPLRNDPKQLVKECDDHFICGESQRMTFCFEQRKCTRKTMGSIKERSCALQTGVASSLPLISPRNEIRKRLI